eukprot:m.770558 g.770558  ORF g.770558 m.770558 type:complete len:105 (-) comp59081_c1_seq29:2408-2722(-)
MVLRQNLTTYGNAFRHFLQTEAVVAIGQASKDHYDATMEFFETHSIRAPFLSLFIWSSLQASFRWPSTLLAPRVTEMPLPSNFGRMKTASGKASCCVILRKILL